MDSRTNTSHPAFSRPLSQPALRDPRHAPIPPPPYTLQTPVRTANPSNYDPFLQRRNTYEDSWQEQTKPTSQAAFSLGTYVGSAPRDALGTATENRERVQENWKFADGRVDRYRSQSGDGKQFMLDYICYFLSTSRALFICAPLHCLYTVLVVHPLLASPLPNATESHIWGLQQLLELSNPGLVAIVQGHGTGRHRIGGDQITFDPASTCISNVHSAISLHNVWGVFWAASPSQRAMLHVAMVFA